MASVTSVMPDRTPSLNQELDELRLVAFGAVPGALLRWQMSSYLNDHNLAVNVLGSAVLGLLIGLRSSPKRMLLMGVGFCGSLTTFSSWMLAASRALSEGRWGDATGLIGLTLGLGMGAAVVGMWCGRCLVATRSESNLSP